MSMGCNAAEYRDSYPCGLLPIESKKHMTSNARYIYDNGMLMYFVHGT